VSIQKSESRSFRLARQEKIASVAERAWNAIPAAIGRSHAHPSAAPAGGSAQRVR
jgi:hypothetical protein